MADKKLQVLRTEIDATDRKLMELLAQRMDIVRRMDAHKKGAGIAAHQPGRWKELLDTRRDYAQQLSLSADMGERFIAFLHHEALRYQSGDG